MLCEQHFVITKKVESIQRMLSTLFDRSDVIRTRDPHVPNVVR